MPRILRRESGWLVVVVVCAVALASLPFAIVKRQKLTNEFFCDQCGIGQRVESDKAVGSTVPARDKVSVEPTELSRWFRTHISTNCLHTWRIKHSSSQIYVSL